MNSTFLYHRVAEVQIWHDYYRIPGVVNFDEAWLPDYSILNDLSVSPTAETASLLKSYRLLYRPTRIGFIVLAQAIEFQVDEFESLITVTEPLKLSFLIQQVNPYFFNFTDLPILNNSNTIYYFNNTASNVVQDNYPLTAAIAAPHYASELDRISKQAPIFQYEAANTAPGEIITFELTDPFLNNTVIKVNNFVDSIRAPLDAASMIRHQLNLKGLKPGRYQLTINRSTTGVETRDFYFLDPIQYPNVIGAIELCVDPNTTFESNFIELNGSNPLRSVLDTKVFRLPFRNRSTNWIYRYNDDNNVQQEFDAGINPLSSHYIEVNVVNPPDQVNDALPLPNPAIAKIEPQIVIVGNTPTVNAVNSYIYL